jgi:hypothetical protein
MTSDGKTVPGEGLVVEIRHFIFQHCECPHSAAHTGGTLNVLSRKASLKPRQEALEQPQSLRTGGHGRLNAGCPGQRISALFQLRKHVIIVLEEGDYGRHVALRSMSPQATMPHVVLGWAASWTMTHVYRD